MQVNQTEFHDEAFEENIPIYNEDQMLRLVERDEFIKFSFLDLLKLGKLSYTTVLEVLFNSYVLEDSVMTDAYNSCTVPSPDSDGDLTLIRELATRLSSQQSLIIDK